MQDALGIVSQNTKPTKLQLQENGLAMSTVGVSVVIRVGTVPSSEIIGTLSDADNGEFAFQLGILPPGTYLAEIDITDAEGTITSDPFVINVRAKL